MVKWKNVKDLYDYASANNMKLLSNYASPFWSDYNSNSARYDKLFTRMFKSFRYFDQTGKEPIDEITTTFIDEVYNHLMINDKKYSELYRVHVIADGDNPLINNYSITENVIGQSIANGNYTSGARSDSSSETRGARNDTTEEQVAGFNSSTYSNSNKTIDNIGSQSNSSSFNKGQQLDNSYNTNNTSENRTKVGKTDVRTSAEVLGTQIELWSMYEFYEKIFKDICAQLLLV